MGQGWIKQWSVQGSGGNVYTVVLVEDGVTWACSCPAFKFRRGECKHIKAVKGGEYDSIESGFDTGNRPVYTLAMVRKPLYDRENNLLLIPLVPFGDKHLMEATIVFYMLFHGYSMPEIRRIRGCCLPKDWTAQAVIEHIQRNGEAEYPESYVARRGVEGMV